MDPQLLGVLTTLGEATGITGLVAATIAILLRIIRRNGCTLSLYSCAGSPLLHLDCERGAPAQRYRPNAPSEPTDDTTESV